MILHLLPIFNEQVWLLLLPALMTTGTRAENVVLYDADILGYTQTMPEQGFQVLSTDIFTPDAFYSAGTGTTNVDTTVSMETAAGFGTHDGFTGAQQHPEAPVLNPADGFTLHFTMALDESVATTDGDNNGDGLREEGGFGAMMIASDARGISLNWFGGSIWALDDDEDQPSDMFARAEGIDGLSNLDTLRHYSLTEYKNAYRLDLDGVLLFDGRRRDYGNYPGIDILGFILDPFEKPNLISFADASVVAGARVRISDVSVVTGYEPDYEMHPRITRIDADTARLRWMTVPERSYTVETSADLILWEPLVSVTAVDFTEEMDFAISGEAALHYRIRLNPPD